MAESIFTLIVILIILALSAWIADVAWPAIETWRARRQAVKSTVVRMDDWIAEGNARPARSAK